MNRATGVLHSCSWGNGLWFWSCEESHKKFKFRVGSVSVRICKRKGFIHWTLVDRHPVLAAFKRKGIIIRAAKRPTQPRGYVNRATSLDGKTWKDKVVMPSETWRIRSAPLLLRWERTRPWRFPGDNAEIEKTEKTKSGAERPSPHSPPNVYVYFVSFLVERQTSSKKLPLTLENNCCVQEMIKTLSN